MISKYYAIENTVVTVTMDFGDLGSFKRMFASPLSGASGETIEKFVNGRREFLKNGDGGKSEHAPMILQQDNDPKEAALEFIASLPDSMIQVDEFTFLPSTALRSAKMSSRTTVLRGWVKFFNPSDEEAYYGQTFKVSHPITVDDVESPEKEKSSGDPQFDKAVKVFVDACG
jgi:hypothetical protein